MTSSQQLIGLLLVPATVIGIIANWLVVYATWKSHSLSQSFSLLTANQAVFNGLHSTISLVYLTPMVVLNSKWLLANSYHCGYVLMICYDASIHAHFLITINRFSAVFLPMVYKKVFVSKWTKCIIVVSFLISLSTLTYFFRILPCQLYYDPQIWVYTYSDLPICYTYAIFGDTGKIMSFSIFNLIVDMITIWKVRKTRKLIRRGQPPVAAFQKKEIDFLKQSFFQSLYAFLFVPTYYTLPMLIISNATNFVCGIVFWCLLHSLDGVLTLAFNSEIRKSLKPKCQLKNMVTVNSMVTIDGKPSVKI